MTADARYPAVLDETLVGTYDAKAHSGAGFVWDAVLEYRVWCHPENGAPEDFDGNDYYFAFASYEATLAFSEETPGAEAPLAHWCYKKSTSTNRPPASTNTFANYALPSGRSSS